MSSSISNSNSTKPSSVLFFSKDAPFCPGCKPKSANSIAIRIDVFPAPMSPESKTLPEGREISAFS